MSDSYLSAESCPPGSGDGGGDGWEAGEGDDGPTVDGDGGGGGSQRTADHRRRPKLGKEPQASSTIKCTCILTDTTTLPAAAPKS